jgi:hypothetical protein
MQSMGARIMLRFCYLALLAVVLAAQSGCCCNDAWPHGKTWCGSQCGPVFWHEWFSHPPECCDPCDRCGNYNGPSGQALYYPGYKPSSLMAGGETVNDYYAPDEAVTSESSPELAEPIGAEELPAGQPSASAFMNEFGQAVSYNAPIDSPRKSRKLGASRQVNEFGQ